MRSSMVDGAPKYPGYNLLRKLSPEGWKNNAPIELWYDFCSTLVNFSGPDHCISAIHAILSSLQDPDTRKPAAWVKDARITIQPPFGGTYGINVLGVPEGRVAQVNDHMSYVFGPDTQVNCFYPVGHGRIPQTWLRHIAMPATSVHLNIWPPRIEEK